ncbi:hypothetical protein C8Q69DRAFT_529443 [Paecilomyces variotii]|uniref:Aspartate transaminase n=1 Tax=Byssochlamys spectabilis TaxID=264951 RepID=A0A443HNW8_BYSSP|nr:hypothetical protein C8Q69DRAFT_529443 [Paecilomyces variotii]RWQ93552.1 hypothetical protein C8Q69DRAFT_529443 [Paecilomyces variotii]
MSSIPAQSSFSALDAVPLDAIYNLKELFEVDKHEKKVILGFGFYRDNNSKPWVLPTVEKTEEVVNVGASLQADLLSGFSHAFPAPPT